jgi:hypothetical protein
MGSLDGRHRPAILGNTNILRRCSTANPFVHIELHTKDPDKSRKFYTSMFDWKMEEFQGMDYTIINVWEGTRSGGRKADTRRLIYQRPGKWYIFKALYRSYGWGVIATMVIWFSSGP